MADTGKTTYETWQTQENRKSHVRDMADTGKATYETWQTQEKPLHGRHRKTHSRNSR
jgi:hypothetical protein